VTAHPDDFLTTEEVAEWLRVSPQTVWDWRKKGRGPQAYKLNHVVRYKRSDVHDWIVKQNESNS